MTLFEFYYKHFVWEYIYLTSRLRQVYRRKIFCTTNIKMIKITFTSILLLLKRKLLNRVRLLKKKEGKETQRPRAREDFLGITENNIQKNSN